MQIISVLLFDWFNSDKSVDSKKFLFSLNTMLYVLCWWSGKCLDLNYLYWGNLLNFCFSSKFQLIIAYFLNSWRIKTTDDIPLYRYLCLVLQQKNKINPIVINFSWFKRLTSKPIIKGVNRNFLTIKVCNYKW